MNPSIPGRTPGTRHLAAMVLCAVLALAPAMSCAAAPANTRTLPRPREVAPPFVPSKAQSAFLDTLEHRTFQWFWDLSDPRTGLTPDRAPTHSFASVSATGFALTAYPIGVERGWVTRAEAAQRTLATLRFFWTSEQDTAAHATGYRGFYYHFLDPATGRRFENVELSTIDTAWLLAGALFCQSYFDGADPGEYEIRSLADSLYLRADWNWANVRPHLIVHGWDPENGFLAYDWRA